MAEKYDLTERDIERLKGKIRPDESGCWLWSGGHFTVTKYALFNVKMSDGVWRPTVAHRAAYRAFVGEIPDGLEMDHLCRNRRCVNPSHLEPVTRRQNVLRGFGPSGEAARKTHCPLGHPYSGDNLYVKPTTGSRECRECMRIRDRRRGPARRAQLRLRRPAQQPVAIVPKRTFKRQLPGPI